MIEVLMSVMNINKKEEYEKLLKDSNIETDVLVINQSKEKFSISTLNNKDRIMTYQETGTSKSRNRALENAKGEICMLCDDDIQYEENYKETVEQAYRDNPKADMIIFYAKTLNKNRKINKISNGKIGGLKIMKARTPEITFKLESVKNKNIKFDERFGPKGIFHKGEETIFLSDCLKNKLNIISVNKQIATVRDDESTWFKDYDKEFLYNQGAVFYRINRKWYKLLIIQYVIRKHKLYKENSTIIDAIKTMKKGAKDCKKVVEGK